MQIFPHFFIFIFVPLSLTACSPNQPEVIAYRVEKARDSQQETKEQFKSTLAQFTEIINFQGGDFQEIYIRLNSEYETSIEKSQEFRKRIDGIEDVSGDFFEEWQEEITQYSSALLKASSERKFANTHRQYAQLIYSMNRTEEKIAPVLKVFQDKVLYLKNNLNAQAISLLKGELKNIESDVSALVAAMEKSINEADAFIKTFEQ